MPTNLRLFRPSVASVGALTLTSLSFLAGCPGSLGADIYAVPRAGTVTVANDSASEIEVEVATLAHGVNIDMDVLEGNPDYVFDEAIDHATAEKLTIAAGSSSSFAFGAAATRAISVGGKRAFVTYRDTPESDVPITLHVAEGGEMTPEGPIRFLRTNATSGLRPCAAVGTPLDQTFPFATLRIDELVKAANGILTLRSGATEVAFDGALFPYEVGDLVTFTSEPSGGDILPAAAKPALSADLRLRATSNGKATWYFTRGNTLPESLRDDVRLAAELGPACIERSREKIAIARPVRLATASGTPIPLGEVVTLETPAGKLTVRVSEALVRTGLARYVSFGPSFRMNAVRGPTP